MEGTADESGFVHDICKRQLPLAYMRHNTQFKLHKSPEELYTLLREFLNAFNSKWSDLIDTLQNVFRVSALVELKPFENL